ncbi:MAG: ATP-binding protein [Fibromonadaceae bacterium]|jgi:hypothetical protein|nr:ATP-binding protein [Fibromonadaceae bacterium]
MNPIINPFAPGAGNRPPSLAGRSDILKNAEIAIKRIQQGKAERCPFIVGLRGVGKTVLLVEIQRMAENSGCQTVMVEAQESSNIARLLVPALRKILLSFDKSKEFKDKTKKALGVLKSFLSGLKIGIGELEISINEPAEIGVADSGLLETDLADLFVAVGEAAQEAKSSATIIIDELQYLPEIELGALIMAVHKVSQKQLPIMLIGAGLPQLLGNTGKAKSYAERLFIFPQATALSEEDSRIALQEPAMNEQVAFTEEALAEIYKQTKGYPYFLQEWGFQSWNIAENSPIDINDVYEANRMAITNLDESFFRVRFDRLTPREQDYLRALAELGDKPQRSGDIAGILGISTEGAAPLRAGLIAKGMIYSPRHGDTAFTVPLFDEFMKRIMPELRR